VAHAEWCDLNFQKNVLHVQPKPDRGWKVKDREDRLKQIPASLMTKLKAAQGKVQSHDLIFPAKNGGVQGHLLRILQNFVEDNASKASGISINSGRHSRCYSTSRVSALGRCRSDSFILHG
jgi:hypothetical protein